METALTLFLLSGLTRTGTGGAGIAMDIAELLTRSNILSPGLDSHSVLFFIFGLPVLFTFGVITYAMMSYLSE